jgi:hypothetical protein
MRERIFRFLILDCRFSIGLRQIGNPHTDFVLDGGVLGLQVDQGHRLARRMRGLLRLMAYFE